jgi:hypothetical protein
MTKPRLKSCPKCGNLPVTRSILVPRMPPRIIQKPNGRDLMFFEYTHETACQYCIISETESIAAWNRRAGAKGGK